MRCGGAGPHAVLGRLAEGGRDSATAAGARVSVLNSAGPRNAAKGLSCMVLGSKSPPGLCGWAWASSARWCMDAEGAAGSAGSRLGELMADSPVAGLSCPAAVAPALRTDGEGGPLPTVTSFPADCSGWGCSCCGAAAVSATLSPLIGAADTDQTAMEPLAVVAAAAAAAAAAFDTSRSSNDAGLAGWAPAGCCAHAWDSSWPACSKARLHTRAARAALQRVHKRSNLPRNVPAWPSALQLLLAALSISVYCRHVGAAAAGCSRRAFQKYPPVPPLLRTPAGCRLRIHPPHAAHALCLLICSASTWRGSLGQGAMQLYVWSFA